MIDRDPMERWTFGRVTLLGDAAHAMLPIGANGTNQAILDARALADTLAANDPPAALKVYEDERIGPTAKVVLSNREYHPERYLDVVDARLKSPEDRIEELISSEEIEEITQNYRKIAGFQVEALNSKGLA